MRTIQHLVLALLLLVGIGAEAAAQNDLRSRVPGRYTATFQGEQIALVLRADGTGDLAGEPGTWSLSGSTLSLRDQAGSVLQATISGDSIVLEVEGMRFVFTREGGAAANRPSGAPAGTQPSPTTAANSGEPFRPAVLLVGKTVKPQGSAVSFRLPKGWKHQWGASQTGEKAYVLTPPFASGKAAVFMSYRILSPDDARLPFATLLTQGANELLGSATAQIALGPEEFTVDGKRAGRLLFRGPLPGQGTTVEAYLGGVLAGQFVYVVLGIYDASLSDRMRPAIDTVLATFRGKAPAENATLKRNLLGCWQNYRGSSGGGGSSSYHRVLSLAPNGTYAYRYTGSISVTSGSSVSEDHEKGTYHVYGNELVLVSDKGATTTYAARRNGASLFLDKREYWHCD